MQPLDFEALRAALADNRLHIAIGKLTKLTLATDYSRLQCDVSIFPEERIIGATMTWDAVGPESGIFSFPQVDDLVLVAFAEGNPDLAFVVRRLTSKVDKIPLRATQGDAVFRALAGKKSWVTSDTRINLSQGDTEPSEPLVLGLVLQSLLAELLGLVSSLATAVSAHTHTSATPGNPTSPPITASEFTGISSDFDNLKGSPVDDGEMLSDLAYTEKG